MKTSNPTNKQIDEQINTVKLKEREQLKQNEVVAELEKKMKMKNKPKIAKEYREE
jgi:hypothetical protein